MSDPDQLPGFKTGTPADHRRELETLFDCATDSDELNDQIREVLDSLPPAGDTTAIIARIGHLLRHTLPDVEPSLQDALTQFPAHLSVATALQLAILAQSPDATGFAVLSITHEDSRAHLQLWRSVVNHAPAYTTEVPLHIAGMAAWAGGEGPVATIALRRSQEAARALAAYDLDGAPHLRHDSIGEVVTPAAWAQMRLSLLASADPRVRHEFAAEDHPHSQCPARPRADRRHPDPGPHRRPPADPGRTL